MSKFHQIRIYYDGPRDPAKDRELAGIMKRPPDFAGDLVREPEGTLRMENGWSTTNPEFARAARNRVPAGYDVLVYEKESR